MDFSTHRWGGGFAGLFVTLGLVGLNACILETTGGSSDTGAQDAAQDAADASVDLDAGSNADTAADVTYCSCDSWSGVEDDFCPNFCECDVDCASVYPCRGDDVCDVSCPQGDDPDCDTCACNRTPSVCNAGSDQSTQECTCDPDCSAAGDNSCKFDDVCDDWCDPSGNCADPDCSEEPDGSCGDLISCACDSDPDYDQDDFCPFGCLCDADCDDTDACIDDDICDLGCLDDPDCGCTCDQNLGICNADEQNSDDVCECDPDCGVDDDACSSDTVCDSYCLARDPDCTCRCDYYLGICEAKADGSTLECACDPTCIAGGDACGEDDHCDTWCDPGGSCEDPDCNDAGEECSR